MELHLWIDKACTRLKFSQERKDALEMELQRLLQKSVKNKKNCKYKMSEQTSGGMILRPNEFGNICYPDTKLIFKGITEKYIVAREGLKGEWLPLKREDILECKRNRLRYKLVDLTFQGEVR